MGISPTTGKRQVINSAGNQQLINLIVKHAFYVDDQKHAWCLGCLDETRKDLLWFPTVREHAEHLVQLIEGEGWRPPAGVITDRADLDDLAFPAIIREIPTDPMEFFPQIWEMGYQTGWCRVGHRFFDIDDCTPRLPVRVLHTTENGDTDA